MSRRRKTLCHAEIENFLSELQTDTSAQQPIVPVDVPLAMDLTKPSRDSHPQISKFVFKSEEELNRDAHLLMRERIRQYVKVIGSTSVSSYRDTKTCLAFISHSAPT